MGAILIAGLACVIATAAAHSLPRRRRRGQVTSITRTVLRHGQRVLLRSTAVNPAMDDIWTGMATVRRASSRLSRTLRRV